jgi:hypothetical protein
MAQANQGHGLKYHFYADGAHICILISDTPFWSYSPLSNFLEELRLRGSWILSGPTGLVVKAPCLHQP